MKRETRKRAGRRPEDCDELARRLAAALEAERLERRRRLWRRFLYLVTLVGAVSSVVAALVMLAERLF